MCSTGAACCATQGALAAMSPGAPKAACQFGEVLAALAVSPEVDTAVPAVWPATPTPELCHATVRSSASMLMFSLPGLDCLAPVFESKLPPQVAESTACNRTHDTGTMKAISPSDKPSPTALPTILAEAVLAEEDTCRVCTVCHDTFSMSADCQDAMDCFSVDGRPTCQTCRHLFDAVPFVPKTEVCINPLCRRKWKQLTPKVLSHFCPPCMRHLEEDLPPAHQSGLDIASVQVMYERWHNIYAEIAEAVGYPAPASRAIKPPETFENREEAREYWRSILAAFGESFKSPPPSEEVRNWNSVYGRRKHYRGIVHRRNRHHCVTVEALEELSTDLAPLRRVTTGLREFLFLDWQQQLREGQEVHFVACPNPSVDERDQVSRIVRLINMPEADEKCPSTPRALQATGAATAGGKAINSEVAIQPSSSMSQCSTQCSLMDETQPSSAVSQFPLMDATPAAFTDVAFSDLMQWSQEELAAPQAPALCGAQASTLRFGCCLDAPGTMEAHVSEKSFTAAAAAAAKKDDEPHPVQLSLEGCLLLDDNGLEQQPPSINLHGLPFVHALPAPPSCPAGTCIPVGLPPGAMVGSAHKQVGPGCSQLMSPRSPCAAYFDD